MYMYYVAVKEPLPGKYKNHIWGMDSSKVICQVPL